MNEIPDMNGLNQDRREIVGLWHRHVEDGRWQYPEYTTDDGDCESLYDIDAYALVVPHDSPRSLPTPKAAQKVK